MTSESIAPYETVRFSRPADEPGFAPDVIVIGAGTAGLAFAHRAAELGGKVLIVEKTGRIGGTLYLSTGMFSAGGTRRQRARGIEDSPADHFNDVMRISKGTVNAELTRLYCDLAPGMVDWLEEAGFEFHENAPAVLFGHEAYDRARIEWGAAGGKSILRLYQRLLYPYLESGQVRIQFDARVDRLIVDHGEARGVDTFDEKFEAPYTVIATGGYASSPDLFARFTNGRRLVSAGALSSTGDGLLLAEKAGGRLHGDQFFLPSFGGIEDVQRNPGRIVQSNPDSWDIQPRTAPQVRPPWEVWVNQDGRRFCREDDASVDNRERALLDQPDMRFYAIFDEAILRQAPPLVPAWPLNLFRSLADEGRLVKKARTLDDLAYKLEMDATALRATIDEYNVAQASGQPDPMGREFRPAPVSEAPFYAVRLQGFVVRTWAGIQVDSALAVRSGEDGVIRNLYAIGEALGAATFSGDSFVAGMSVGPALTFGRRLAEQLVVG